MEYLVYCLGVFVFCYFFFVWIGYTALLFATFTTVINKYNESQFNNLINTYNENPMLPLSIIIPAFNEGKRILNAISSILQSEYKNTHIIIVNDGSTDTTLQLLIDTYRLTKIPSAFRKTIKTGEVYGYYASTIHPNFIVVDKEHSPFANSGADCINAGLNVCRTPLYLTVDSDTVLEPKALSYMLFAYLANPSCVAVGGNIYVPDTDQIKEGVMVDTTISSNITVGMQVCEYMRSFLYGREGWTFMGGCMCHPGAFTLLETKAVKDMGGYDSYNFAYDAEIIIKLHRYMRKNKYPYSIVYAPSAIAWSEVPTTLKKLWRQRNFWQRGLLRCMANHKGMILNPKYGITGMIAFPFYVIFEIYGPVIESIAYITLILAFIFTGISYYHLVWYMLLTWGYLLFITMSCVLLSILTYNKFYRKMDVVRIFLLTLLELIVQRPHKAFCALYSSAHYCWNRLRGKPL